MAIDGYEKYAEGDADGVFTVYFSDEVIKFLRKEGKPGTRNTRSVKKALAIIENIRRNGLRGLSNTEQFNDEGRHPTGRAKGGDQKVYAVKADQVRVYGGIISVADGSNIFFVEAAVKKKSKADQVLLQRVAKALGEVNDEIE